MPDLQIVPPAHLWIPPRAGSHADEAIDLMALAGRELDEEQRVTVDAMLSYGEDRRWSAFETVRIEPRQNGKTGGELLTVVMYDLFLGPPDRIVWTAHLLKTAMDAFNDLVQLIDGCPTLSKRVRDVITGKGNEAIVLHNGGRLEFMARSEGGGRGLGGKRIVFDEALFLSAEAMGALIPTLAARSVTGDPQINYASSAAILRSDHLRTLRDRGRKGDDPSLVYVEHCAPGSWDEPGCEDGPDCTHLPGTSGCALDDERLWKLANHALGKRISYTYVRRERRAMPTPEQFGVERLGWHVEPAGVDQVSMQAWADCADADSAPTSRPVFMLDVSPGSRSAAILAAMYRPDGLPHLEVVAHARGVDWVPGRAAELKAHRPLDWWIDPAGPAGALLPALRDVGIEPQQMTARDLGQACAAMAALIDQRALRHLNDPVLTKALASAGRRDIGDGLWAFSRRKSEVDICPAVGAAGALYGLSMIDPEPPPPPAPQVDSTDTPRSEMNALATAGF